MTPELRMNRAVPKLRELADEIESLQRDWKGLADDERKERIGRVLEMLNDLRTLAENWRLLAEANGVVLPEKDQ